MAPKLIDDNSTWPKSNYEIKEEDGIQFIVPMRGAKETRYNPLLDRLPKVRPDIEEENLQYGPHIALGRINPEKHDDILEFVNMWGLLGLSNTKKYTSTKSVLSILSKEENAFRLFEEGKLYRNNKRRNGEKDREPVIIFQAAVRTYQTLINDINRYKRDNPLLKLGGEEKRKEFRNAVIDREEKEKDHPEGQRDLIEAMTIHESQAFSTYLHLNEMLEEVHPQSFFDIVSNSDSPGWGYNSLIGAIYIKFFTDKHEGKKFRRCKMKKCNKQFITTRPSNEYCSDNCKGYYHSQKHNEKKWLKQSLLHYEDYNNEDIEAIFHTLIEEGYSGEVKIIKEIGKRLD
ncbi:hypothetical protein [Alteribacter keqinensis]|uniref:CGNR zinc finger domain-containing protein n=1 Tax=Alteribacter keqinensis TaxID=2483800 RepID=A0A3M7TLJ0_9BACI|nr:hypothetical protein [Alteribacter keqinensis]RNA66204.1 hypothetical protein EBO34_18920 [Alteribacter keqinensis]